jgi:hypothetical protein
MFRGDWRSRFTPKLISGFVIWSIIALIGFGAITRGILEQVEYEGRSYQRSSEYAADTYGPAYEACLMLVTSSQTDCIGKANNEHRENERKEQDLIAQQTTAIWTFLMGCAAIIGMALSALGVYLVWITFRETRKNNGIAQDVQRARVIPSANHIHRIDHIRASSTELFFENAGLSPAYMCQCFYAVVDVVPPDFPTNLAAGDRHTLKAGEPKALKNLPVFSSDKHIIGKVEYKTIFGEAKASYFCFGFTWDSNSKSHIATNDVPETWPKDT